MHRLSVQGTPRAELRTHTVIGTVFVSCDHSVLRGNDKGLTSNPTSSNVSDRKTFDGDAVNIDR